MARELDKWQVREAQAYARDNNVTYDAAVKVLFPEDEAEVPAEPEPAEESPADTSTKVKVTK